MKSESFAHTSAQRDRDIRKPDRPRARWRRLALLATLVLLFWARTVQADCPQGDRMRMLIDIPRNSVPMQELWDMGVDVFGDDGDRLQLRVCGHIAEQLAGRGVVYEVIYEDLYEAYRQYRPTPPEQVPPSVIRRGESFADYHDIDETVAAMQRIAANHPDLVAMEVIGTSIEGRLIHALRISNHAATVAHDRPAMVVVGCHHAREWISVEVPLYLADYLAENYLVDGGVTRLLNYTELWIIPVLNPDGYAFTWTDFPNNRFWRKNRRDNGDGTMGVDMNRNYDVDLDPNNGIGWGGEGSSGQSFSETYRGTAPFSEPETQALRDLMDEAAPNGRTFVSLLSYHNYSQIVMYPNGWTLDAVTNMGFYERVAGEMTRRINEGHTDPEFDYTYGQTSQVLYVASGGTTDWAHNVLDATGIIIELRPKSASFEVPPEQILPTCQENLPAFLHMAEATMIPDHALDDADGDGFIDAVGVGPDDYCPNSPAGDAVDAMGCAASESDVDEDGVLNAEDACRQTPAGQQVGLDGCRVATLFTLRVSSNLNSLNVTLEPPDIDAAGDAEASPSGFSREYAAETTITLLVPEMFDDSRFQRWVVDGEPQPEGEPAATITRTTDVEVEAVYIVPDRIEIEGFSRIPDLREDGLAFRAMYRANTIYTDGSSQPTLGAVAWTLSSETIGMLTASGELLVYDVAPAAGEVDASITATMELGGVSFSSAPFRVNVFDVDTLSPACHDITLTGPDGVDSGGAIAFIAAVTVDGDLEPRRRTEEVRWTVSWPDPTETSPIPAAISSGGTLSVDWVPTDTRILVRGAYVNDDTTVCLAEQPVTINAGEISEKPSAESASEPITVPCGGAGTIGLMGLVLGLTLFRIGRR